MSFKTGDVVQLKSGGSPMTVLDASVRSDIKLIWMDRDGKMQHAAVTESVLEESVKAGGQRYSNLQGSIA